MRRKSNASGRCVGKRSPRFAKRTPGRYDNASSTLRAMMDLSLVQVHVIMALMRSYTINYLLTKRSYALSLSLSLSLSWFCESTCLLAFENLLKATCCALWYLLQTDEMAMRHGKEIVRERAARVDEVAALCKEHSEKVRHSKASSKCGRVCVMYDLCFALLCLFCLSFSSEHWSAICSFDSLSSFT